ncbi:MAG: hypothetical protein JXA09_04025 [Anaerolineae bacterium]|nr:hypothetical protein [Anaerolineae bacterium]
MRALVVPTRREREAVLRALPGAVPVAAPHGRAWRAGNLLIVEPGMGPQCAAAVLPALAQALDGAGNAPPGALWLLGWCGGLQPDLGVADVVLADATLAADATVAAVTHPPPAEVVAWARRAAAGQGRRLVVGPVLTSPVVLATAAHKRAAARTGAVAVEMEAGPLAAWAAAHGAPFVHLRVVLDPAPSDLPTHELRRGRKGAGQEGDALLRRALLRPRAWPAVWRLLRQVRVAGRAIATLAAAAVAPDGPLSIGS